MMPFAPVAVLVAWAFVVEVIGIGLTGLWVVLLLVAAGLQVTGLVRRYRR